MVYGDGLENRCPRKGTVGSNPTPSATSSNEAQHKGRTDKISGEISWCLGGFLL